MDCTQIWLSHRPMCYWTLNWSQASLCARKNLLLNWSTSYGHHHLNSAKMDVQLFKNQTLGIGSYGKVCRARYGSLPCAAKLIHETLFDPEAFKQIAPEKEHRLPFRRFEQECEVLHNLRHPNVIQYLSVYQDPDTKLPVLLMELMDGSLTHFLNNSLQQIR